MVYEVTRQMNRPKCTLVLSSGERFEGELLGAPLNTSGELVFTTAMVGYCEAMTDPSYFGQILTFSYPLIGNYGVPALPRDDDGLMPSGFESKHVHVAGVIVGVDTTDAFHWNSIRSLDQWLKEHDVPGIAGLDTRHLVHLIRNSDRLRGRFEVEGATAATAFSGTAQSKAFYDPSEHEILDNVSTKKRRVLGKGKVRIGLVDCGVKWNIIRQLINLDCEVELLPWRTDLSTVDCHGLLLSNGPGDPSTAKPLIESLRKQLQGTRPILGICLGHQILSLAAGAKTERMAYGHRSHNQPVCQPGTRRGYITSQNHGYVVVGGSLPEGWEPWFVNVNDQTIEGIRHKSKPFRSVQFHPEAAGGPRDTAWIMAQFVAEVLA